MQDFTSPDEYRLAVEALSARLAGQPELRDFAAALELIVRYEQAQAIAAPERFLGRVVRGPRARRTALISDIHGNHDGLLAVLADIAERGCDRIVCLGDLVEGGTGDEAVVETIRHRGIATVRGNHDEHNDVKLEKSTREFLRRLPEAIVEDDVHFTHISPRRKKRKVNHAVEAWNVFEDGNFRLLFVGHAHVPLLFSQGAATYGEAALLGFEYNAPVALDPASRYIVCVGSVGYGRDQVGKLRYAIHDHEEQTVEFRTVEGPLLEFDHALRKRLTGPLELVPLPAA